MEQALQIKDKIREENRVAVNWLIHYRERKRDHENRRQEILANTKEKDDNVGGGRSTVISRPTESLACKLEEHDNSNNARWLQAVEDVKSIIGPKKRQLLELRQECRFYISPDGGRPGWIAPIQIRFGEMTGWTPSEQVIKNNWNDIVVMAVRVAIVRGCKF